MKWKVISASVRGSSHQRSGLPNQDAVDHALNSRDDDAPTVLAVSDGHGGARYFRSQVGSTLAVHLAVTHTRDFLTQSPTLDPLAQLCPQIVQAWLSAVAADLHNNPFSEDELSALEVIDGPSSRQAVIDRPELAYGATLLVTAVVADRILYLQLGDGDILSVAAGGKTTRPISADDRLVANQTTSLCQPEAWREFRVASTQGADQLPLMVLLSSDGYMNSFRSEDDFMQIGQDYLNLLREHGSDSLTQDLPGILKEATQQGSGDDITLGILHRAVLERSSPPTMAPTRKVLPPLTKSAIIRDLKTEQSTQQQKLAELETSYFGARKHIQQLWILIAVVLLAITAFATQPLWMPLFSTGAPKKPTPTSLSPHHPNHPATPDHQDPSLPPIQEDPPTGAPTGSGPGIAPRIAPIPIAGESSPAAPATTKSDRWVITFGDGHQLLLEANHILSAADVALGKPDTPYAKVKSQDGILKLTNLSHDQWTVTMTGSQAKAQYNPNDSVPLQDGIHINFPKSASATVTIQRK